MGRRDPDDLEWKKVKEEVKKRDKGIDRMVKIVTPIEMVKLRRNAGSFLYIIDPAHYLAVSEAPEHIYEKNNIVSLNRFSHSNLDNFRDPIDGHPISKEEVHNWWIRLLKADPEQYKYLQNKGLI